MSITTPAERAAQRRRRRLITFITLPGIAIGTLGVGTAAAEGWIVPPKDTTCVGQVVKAPAKTSFAVNVLNATYRPGTAGVVAKLVTKHGFRVGTVGNDEELRSVRGEGEIRFAPKALDAALLVQKQILPGARLLEDRQMVGPDVQLVLGKEFKAVQPLPPRPPAQASKTVVNVYNTTYYEGLGKKVSQEMTHRGFLPGKVGMDPRGTWQRGTALIRHGEDGDLAAKLVAQHVPGATFEQDGRKGTAVDLVIGMQLTGLDKLTPLSEVPPPVAWVPPAWPTVIRPCED